MTSRSGRNPSLLSHVLSVVAPELRAASGASSLVKWMDPVSTDGDGAVLLEARLRDGDDRAGSLRFSMGWPRAQHSLVESDSFQISLNLADGLDPRIRQSVADDAETVARRLVEIESRLPDLLAELFPRDGEGCIDWDASPLSRDVAATATGQKSYVKVSWPTCGARCAFCTRSQRDIDGEPPPLYRLDQLYRMALELGTPDLGPRLLRFGGDEPLRHPEIDSMIGLASGRGWRPIQMFTCAVDLLEEERVERLVASGVTEFRLPVYGVTAEVHDRVVGVDGHFDALRRALTVLDRKGAHVQLHSVCLTWNLHQIEALPAFASELGGELFEILFPRDEGASRVPMSEIMPRLSDLPAMVTGFRFPLQVPCLDLVPPTGPLPPGLMPGTPQEILGSASRGVEESRRKEYAPQCRSCVAHAGCSGVYRGYFAVHGTDELVPRS